MFPAIIKEIESFLRNEYRSQRLRYEISVFDRFRLKYRTLTFSEKKKLARRWLIRYPEQTRFEFSKVSSWLVNNVGESARIIEVGGWRGDLALMALSSFPDIKYWHNYDLIEFNQYQKCTDHRYKLISLDDYLWNKSLKYNYNALVATHMIEHINWNELCRLIKWIPADISSVLFQAPIIDDAEDYSWSGDYSSHVLEKGWAQISSEMARSGFKVLNKESKTVIYVR